MFRGPGVPAELDGASPTRRRGRARSCSGRRRTRSAAPTCGSCAARRPRASASASCSATRWAGTIAELGDGVEGYERATWSACTRLRLRRLPALPTGASRTSARTSCGRLRHRRRPRRVDADPGGRRPRRPAGHRRRAGLRPSSCRWPSPSGLLPQRHGPVPRRCRRRRRDPRGRSDRAVPPAARRDRRGADGDRLRPVARPGGRWPPSSARASPSTRRATTSPRSCRLPRAGSARTSPWSASVARSWSTTR